MTSPPPKNLATIVAAIQMCSSHLIEQNLENARKWLDEAALHGAKLVVLPENFALMGLSPQDKLLHQEKFGQGKIQTFLSEAAKANKIWIVGGTIPIAGLDKNKVRAACLLYDETGNLVTRYDKIHLFDALISPQEIHQESLIIEGGDKVVAVDTPVGKVGFAICFDVRFPSLFTALMKCGIDIIVLPSAFTFKTGEAHWEILTRARAIDTFSYLIAAAQAGTHTNGRTTYGHSLIVNPWGEVLAKKEEMAEGVIYANIDLNFLKSIRQTIPLAY